MFGQKKRQAAISAGREATLLKAKPSSEGAYVFPSYAYMASARNIIHAAKKEILRRPIKQAAITQPLQEIIQPAVFASTVRKPKTQKNTFWTTFSLLKDKACSTEFWAGLLFGIVTRVATKVAIEQSVISIHGLSPSLTGFIACAGAGMMAGMVVHLVRTLCRNARLENGHKESYFGAAFFASALTGLLGGAVGGCAANAGALMAQAGSLTAGLAAGASAGIMNAIIREARLSRDDNYRGGFVVRAATYGVTGAIMGVVAADLLSTHESVAATIDASPQTVMTTVDSSTGLASGQLNMMPPPHIIIVGPPDGSALAAVPHLQSPPVALVAATTPATPTIVDRSILCAPIKHIHHIKHIRHIRHVAPLKSVEVYDPLVVVIDIQAPPPPPHFIATVPIMGPPPAPPMSAFPCDNQWQPQNPQWQTHGQLDLRGPCASPGAACVTRVSFDQNGIATHAVLEPRGYGQSGTNYEVSRADGRPVNPATVVASDGSDDDLRVSLVTPFVNHSGMAGNVGPMPA